MKKAIRALLVAALMVSIGAHWALLQSAAWVGMAVTYTVESGSLVNGLSDTFSGERPCPLCKVVAKGYEAEKESREGQPAPTKTKDLKLTLTLVSVPQYVFPSAPAAEWSTISWTAQRLAKRPLIPPPQAIAG